MSVTDEPPIDVVDQKSRWQKKQTYRENVALAKRVRRNPCVVCHPKCERIEQYGRGRYP